MIILQFAVSLNVCSYFDYSVSQELWKTIFCPYKIFKKDDVSPSKKKLLQKTPDQILLDYLNSKIGSRFLLPFGRRKLIGILIMAVNKQSVLLPYKLKPILDCLDDIPVFSRALLALAQWMAQYYHVAIGEVLFMMLPPPLRESKKIVLDNFFRYELTLLGKVELKTVRKHFKNRYFVSQLFLEKEKLNHNEVNGFPLSIKKIIKEYCDNGWIKCLNLSHNLAYQRQYLENLNGKIDSSKQLNENSILNLKQKQVINTVVSSMNQFQVYLLNGVTGSGKTEVYLEIAKYFLAKGQQVLILVPEINLTPQFLARAEHQLNIPIGVIHSQITDNLRLEIWKKARLNQYQVIIGTRTSLFTHIPNLGIIIIDEEHDSSYRSRTGIRFSAKDSAIIYANSLNIPVLLGSATPSLESVNNYLKGKFQLLSLPERAIGQFVKWEVIPFDYQKQANGLMPELVKQIRETLKRKEKVILFLNRRGISPVLFCCSCHWIAHCPQCDAYLTLHPFSLNCHHCGYQMDKLNHCPQCYESSLIPLGQGTQKIEQTLNELFPNELIIRLDRDAVYNQNTLNDALSKINQASSCIILGTKMLSKGHDFDDVTLVGIINTDHLLFSSDYHGEEQLAQLLVQVTGRGGRRDNTHNKILIQSAYPEESIFKELPKFGYMKYAKYLLNKRQEFNLPPFSYQAHIIAESKKESDCLNFLNSVCEIFEKHYPSSSHFKLTPVMPCFMSRRKGFFRKYILIQASRHKILNQILNLFYQLFLKIKRKDIHFYIEVDPPEEA